MAQSIRPRWLRVSGLLAGLSVVGAAVCMAQERAVAPADPAPYRIQVNDVLEFLFFKVSELNQTRTVGPDGEVALQLIGSVRVAGRTVAEITDELTTRYTRELVQPQLTVSVKEYSGLKVYVGGEVGTPGIQVYRGGLSALQAIVAAGGSEHRQPQQRDPHPEGRGGPAGELTRRLEPSPQACGVRA